MIIEEPSSKEDIGEMNESDSCIQNVQEDKESTSQKLPTNVVVVDYDQFYEPGGYFISLSNIEKDGYIEIIPKINSTENDDDIQMDDTKKYNYRQYFSMNHFYDVAKGYDDNDPFIDNDDAHNDVMNPFMDTEYGGFYINSGKLKLKNIKYDEYSSEFTQKKPRKYKKKNHHTYNSEVDTNLTECSTPTKKNVKIKKQSDSLMEPEKKTPRKRKIKANVVNVLENVTTEKPIVSCENSTIVNDHQSNINHATNSNIVTDNSTTTDGFTPLKDKNNASRSASNSTDITIELPDFLPADHKNAIIEITEIIKNIPETFNDPEFLRKWNSFCFLLHNNIKKSKHNVLRYIMSKTGISKGTLLLQIARCLTDDTVEALKKHFQTVEKVIEAAKDPTVDTIIQLILETNDFYHFIEDINKMGSVTRFCGKCSPSIKIENEYIDKLSNLCPKNISKNEFFVSLYAHATTRKNKLKKFKSIQFIKNVAFKHGATTEDINNKVESLSQQLNNTTVNQQHPVFTPNITLSKNIYNNESEASSGYIVTSQNKNNQLSNTSSSKNNIYVLMPNRQVAITTPDELRKMLPKSTFLPAPSLPHVDNHLKTTNQPLNTLKTNHYNTLPVNNSNTNYRFPSLQNTTKILNDTVISPSYSHKTINKGYFPSLSTNINNVLLNSEHVNRNTQFLDESQITQPPPLEIAIKKNVVLKEDKFLPQNKKLL